MILFGWRPDRDTWLLAGLSLVAAGIVLVRVSFYGAGVNSDVINFIGIARNILGGDGLREIQFVDAGGQNPLSLWVPLYPLVLVGFSFGVLDPYAAAGPVNAVILGVTVFAVGHYWRSRLESGFIWFLAVSAVAFSFPLIWMASFAMSDALFILMSVLALIYGDKFLGEGQTAALIWAAVFSALAWQTRYIGVAAPAVIGLLLLLQRDTGLRVRVKRVGIYSLIVALPMALWMVWTYLRIGSPVREPRAVDYSVWTAFDDLAAVLVAGYDNVLLIPLAPRIPGGVWVGMAVLLVLLAVGIVGIIRRSRRGAARLRMPVAVFGGFMMLYMAVLVGGTMSGYAWPAGGITVRYLVPMWIPALIVVALVLDVVYGAGIGGKSWGRAGVGAVWVVRVALLAVFGLFVLGMLTITALDTNRVKTATLSGISTMHELDLWPYIRDNPIRGRVYSNATLPVYFFTDGGAEYRIIPQSRGEGYIIGDVIGGDVIGGDVIGGGNGEIAGGEQLRRWVSGLPWEAYIVWIYGWYGNEWYDFGAADLRALAGLELVAGLDDGVIFRVKGEMD